MGLNQHPDAEIAQLLKQLDQGSKIMLIQVNGPETNEKLQTSLHICAHTLESLLSLSEAGFTEKLVDKDVILFTRVQKGTRLMDRVTHEVLETYLGRTGASMLDQPHSREQSPLNYRDLMNRLNETMGSGAQMIRRAIAKALYRELRSNPGVLQNCTTKE